MAAVIANDRLPEDTSESAKETLALLEPFLTAWRDGDPQGMFARIADGQVDYIDYCQQITHTVLSPQKLETKEAIRPFLKGFFQIASDFTYTTVAAYGDRCQLTVEAVISFTLQAEMPGSPVKKGDTATLPGVSIFKLDEEGLVVFKHDNFLLSHEQ
ncbi:hypothetical protein PG989_015579 [Apiospora arundinis]